MKNSDKNSVIYNATTCQFQYYYHINRVNCVSVYHLHTIFFIAHRIIFPSIRKNANEFITKSSDFTMIHHSNGIIWIEWMKNEPHAYNRKMFPFLDHKMHSFAWANYKHWRKRMLDFLFFFSNNEYHMLVLAGLVRS